MRLSLCARCLIWFALIGSLLAGCAGGAPQQTISTPAKSEPKSTGALATSVNPEVTAMIQPKRTLNIAHRGARSLAPENTMAAARKAFEIGADMWELDVAMSKDGELVILHDDTLARTSNVAAVFPDRKSAEIHEFTLAELRKLDFGSWYNETDPFKQIVGGAVSKADQESYKGEPIPTLREALTYTRDNHWKVNIEIKDATGTPSDAAIVEKVVALVKELNMVGSVIISSFNHAYLERVKAANPDILTAALSDKFIADLNGLLTRIKAQAFNPSVKLIATSTIRPLRELGFDVYVWTVNDEATFKSLIQAGASGIITDYPQLLKKVLSNTP